MRLPSWPFSIRKSTSQSIIYSLISFSLRSLSFVHSDLFIFFCHLTGIHPSDYANIATLLTIKYGLISTPSVTDLDGDGRLDLVYAYFRSVCPLPKNIEQNVQVLKPLLSSCHSTSLDIFAKELNSDCPFAPLEHQQWLGYLGTYGDGIYGM